MSVPLYHLEYEDNETAEKAVERVPSSSADPTSVAYAGLSPFDIPEGVAIHIASPDYCRFQFEYPNSEPGDAHYREASRDGRVFVKLGRNTGKILEVVLHDASIVLATGSVPIDLNFVPLWQAELPWHAKNTCRRSATLIHAMLATIPDRLRVEIRQALRDIPAPQSAR